MEIHLLPRILIVLLLLASAVGLLANLIRLQRRRRQWVAQRQRWIARGHPRPLDRS